MIRTYDVPIGKILKSKLLTVLALCICFGSMGCTGSDRVSAFSAVAVTLRETLPRVTNDVPESCTRRNQLRADVPKAEGTEVPLDCTAYVALAGQLGADQAMLITYLEAISRLAAKQTPIYPAAIHQATVQIAGLPGVSAHAAAASTAAGGLAAALADAATKHYRERTLGKLMVTTDPSVQELCAALEKIMGPDYASLLDDEELETTAFYNEPIAERRKADERLTLILVERQRDDDLAQLRRRRAAARAYVTALELTAKLHAQMAAFARKHGGRKQVDQELAPTLIALKTALSDLEVRLR